jgi:hypothetical protein
MDPDMNKYDLLHVTTGHPIMSKEEWEHAYRLAWDTYYTPEHVETVLRRAAASRLNASTMLYLLLWFSGSMALEGVHPLESGLIRRKVRRDRRPSFPIESPLIFYPKYVGELIGKHIKFVRKYWKMYKFSRALKRDPHAREYMDTALSPVTGSDLDLLEMFQVTEGARTVAAKARQRATVK